MISTRLESMPARSARRSAVSLREPADALVDLDRRRPTEQLKCALNARALEPLVEPAGRLVDDRPTDQFGDPVDRHFGTGANVDRLALTHEVGLRRRNVGPHDVAHPGEVARLLTLAVHG